ncbi:DHH family phosphoesterase, partial [bacterium]|nr:DHH family phosphoesterase [bacterium]
MSDIPSIVKEILKKRGIEEIEQFIYPTVQKTFHPFSFPSIEEGCKVIAESISKKEKIFIYGDGDIDGIISVFFLNKVFSEVNIPFSFYLTHRLEDYEIETSIVKTLIDEGYSLMITVDCGTSSHEFLKEAEKCGLKVVVIDHHIFDTPVLPSFHTYINPNFLSRLNLKNYLSSASLVFKVIEGLKFLLPGLEGKSLYDTFELIGLTVLSDHLPVIGENRIFLHYCLKNLLFTKVKGLRFFLEHLKIKEKLKVEDIVMKLNPKLNAPGRFGRPEIVLNLLMEEDDYEIMSMIKEIEYYDRKRYGEIKKIISKIENMDNIEDG